jgi:hypothetical protein
MPKGTQPRASGEQEVFISGAHLRVRETDEDGKLVLDLTYDPDHKVLYQLAPNFEVVAPNDVQPDLAYTGNSRPISGHPCRELTRKEPDVTAHVWVTSELRVDPAAFRGFPIAGFAKQLEYTGGALELHAKVEHADHIMHLEVASIEAGPVGDEVWQLGEARAKAGAGP